MLSYVALSLIKSQDSNVVLFYYKQESRMNVGVSLFNPPREARTPIHTFTIEGPDTTWQRAQDAEYAEADSGIVCIYVFIVGICQFWKHVF